MPVRGLGIFGAFLFNMETEKTTEQELDEVNQSIIELEENIEFCYNQIKIKESYLDRLKEQRTNLLNYLNTDNN